jgi:hypothetical protein
LVDFVRLLDETGATRSYGIEILSSDFEALDPCDAAIRAARSAELLLERAGSAIG